MLLHLELDVLDANKRRLDHGCLARHNVDTILSVKIPHSQKKVTDYGEGL
jgi:hypothetical protein